MKKSRLSTDVIHIFVLCGFAVAQPIYDLLQDNGEFFVAHRLGPLGIVLFVIALSIGFPAVLALVEIGASYIGVRLQRGIHLLFVFVLATALALPIIHRSFDLPPALATATTLVLAAIFAVAYVRLKAISSFVSVLAIGAVAFPVIFLLFTSIANLVLPASAGGQSAVAVRNEIPIVFLILDEFEAGALLDEDKKIDAIRFPNFAAFAKDALWFPNATSAWFETKRAVPAILTGRVPTSGTALPTVQSHPENLFTWLGGRYHLTVRETLTALCPETACPTQRGPTSAARTVRDVATDLGVIYLHVLLPPSIARQWLPPMDTGWKGFATAGNDDDHRDAKNGPDPVLAYQDRGEQFTAFLSGIDGGSRNRLHFLHVLLPHVPYTYLPGGQTYLGKATEGLLDKGLGDTVWVDDGVLPEVAYQRFLLQIGYVDRMVGRLIDRLKEVGLYNDALVVITSDHGKSFRPGEPKRLLTAGNASDVLQVPLFVKLPGQSQGRRIEHYVSNIDILPTIADVLGTPLPWPVDGRSLIDPTYQGREAIELKALGESRPGWRFEPRNLASYPRLPWKIATFGSRTPLEELAVRTRYPELLGMRVDAHRVSEPSADYVFDIEQERHFANVKLGSSFLPARLTGEIRGPGLPGKPLTLAIAVNGTIHAVTRTTQWADKAHYMSLMLPEAAFRDGENTLDVFSVEPTGSGLALVRIPSGSAGAIVTLAQDRNGEEALVSVTGGSVPIRAGAVKGFLDRAQGARDSVTLSGWALEAEARRPAERVVVLADGKFVYSGPLGRARQDVARVFGTDSARDSGFLFAIPRTVVGNAKLRIFAVSRDQVAGELGVSEPALTSLARIY